MNLYYLEDAFYLKIVRRKSKITADKFVSGGNNFSKSVVYKTQIPDNLLLMDSRQKNNSFFLFLICFVCG